MAKKPKRPIQTLRGPMFQAEWEAYHKRQRELFEAAKALQPPAATSATPGNPTKPAALPSSPIPGDDGQAKAA